MKVKMGTSLSFAIFLVILHQAYSEDHLGALGPNNGVNLRLNEKGLRYVADKAMEGYYEYITKKALFPKAWASRTLFVKNQELVEMCKPTFNISFEKYGHNRWTKEYSADVTDFKCDKIKFVGDYEVWENSKAVPSKAGTFSITVTRIKNSHAAFGVELREKEELQSTLRVYVRGHYKPKGTIDLEITGNDDDVTLRESIKKTLMEEAQDLIKDLLDVSFSIFDRVVYGRIEDVISNRTDYIEVQDPRLRVFYWILQAPNFTETSVDTLFWGETTWKRHLSKAPKGNLTWPHVPEAETKMVTIQLTDYIMNSIGYLMYNDNALSFNITREQITPSARDMLSFSDCTNCAGDMFPLRKEKNAGGSMEVRIKASSPPRLVLETDDQPVVSFKGHFEGYVAMPGERWPQQILAVDAELRLPLELRVVDNNIVGKILVNETKFVKVDREYPRPSVDVNMEIFQELVKVGFIGPLNGIFQKGFPLPMYNGTSCVNPEVFVKSNLIMVSTDLEIDPALLQ